MAVLTKAPGLPLCIMRRLRWGHAPYQQPPARDAMTTQTPPPITAADRACAAAGDRVGPEDAAWFLGVAPEKLRDWRRRRHGPAFERLGHRLFRYSMADLLAWRERPSERV